ncbi:SAM-dependent methyltransferase [Afipia sp. Root123D2]|uniref:small ribosomal subunit Rsm22 family protein n=1 Tax=Afipia sp. Root123D2 TaxID=1736436 RepID=UPI0007006BB0|nr:small ribosomal subunit Rsm22 family protein [Afipia sp. Root123D2]KQW20794.1 SAM-dependent methyltransferase [Afipia sp. Root123D2]
MPTFALPSELKAALDRKIEGLSRNDAARRAVTISNTYRSGGTSAPIRTEADALAYALARMPATFAATAACLHALQDQQPDFMPRSLLDVGAGPGTATWAAAEAFSSIDAFNLLDANAALRALAVDLVAESHRLNSIRYGQGDASQLIAGADSADLVIASYVINELNDAARDTLADLMWTKTRDTVVVIEPGTPAGYARIIALRARLIAQGAHVVAPCPHDNACPLEAPDWCHFVQRLPRSRAHKHLKGADLPFEDEKFSYVVLSRTAPDARPSRVLAQPALTKIAVTAKVCTPQGVERVTAPHRDKAFYARARRWNWGDAIAEGSAE